MDEVRVNYRNGRIVWYKVRSKRTRKRAHRVKQARV
jgi:hypothetical protein